MSRFSIDILIDDSIQIMIFFFVFEIHFLGYDPPEQAVFVSGDCLYVNIIS